MKKRCISALVCACILFLICVLPSSAVEKGVFRAAVIVDSEDIKGFASSEGTLRDFISAMRESGASAAFYFDADDISESADLVAALMYLKVNGYRVGIFANDAYSAYELNSIIKYIIKSASRLAVCEADGERDLTEAGYSVVSDFDIVFSSAESSKIALNESADTLVCFDLHTGSAENMKTLSEYAAENGAEIRALTEKIN